MNNLGGYADIDTFIDTVSQSCPDSMVAKEFLEDYINKVSQMFEIYVTFHFQPGKALLIVKGVGKTVTITQTRYLSTYFNSEHMDNMLDDF